MKKLLAIGILALAPFAFAQTAKTPKPAKKTAAKKAPTAQPLTIPKDAVLNPDGTYSYTDKSGKKWLYTKTPFGISKTEDVSAPSSAMPAPAPAGQETKAIDKGDTVTFQRNTPFGATTWDKKKTDLTDEERHILEAQQQPKPE
jgi:hypothetical protein